MAMCRRPFIGSGKVMETEILTVRHSPCGRCRFFWTPATPLASHFKLKSSVVLHAQASSAGVTSWQIVSGASICLGNTTKQRRLLQSAVRGLILYYRSGQPAMVCGATCSAVQIPIVRTGLHPMRSKQWGPTKFASPDMLILSGFDHG